jgi:AraC-like DNA-binding protein
MITREMVANLAKIVADAPGSQVSTAIPHLTLWWSPKPTKPTPALFEPKFYILLQGAKRLTIGGNVLDYGVGRCAVSSVGLPFTSQVVEASPESPYIGLELRLDAGIVASLLLEMPGLGESNAPAFSSAHADDDVTEPIDRLARLLIRPAEIPILAPHYERELYYRLLQGPMSGTLRQVVQQNTHFQQVRTAVEWICNNPYASMSVELLATSVGMSVTSFHRHFKAVTSHSPLAYQRHIRLLHARKLLSSGATNVTNAAFATGYASSSQFSREYKRMFGVSPISDSPVLH